MVHLIDLLRRLRLVRIIPLGPLWDIRISVQVVLRLVRIFLRLGLRGVVGMWYDSRLLLT